MREELLKAVQTGRTWLDRFTRREYTKAFKAYTEQFGPVYMAAVRETNGDETALRALADSLLDGLENGWKRQRIWNRSAVKVNEKQMMVDYLSPMLLGLAEPGCPRFAHLLRDRWEERWPRDPYYLATYSEIQNGFRNVILGLDMANKHLDKDMDS